ncbi:D-alanyl-D-alanine carboxypeptidase/D-alanyl-D-alanine-endopeptidase [Pseudophaeobacter sp.]|jgi:D-alanyl-D-alanine carboxypeptidase/D-alanyl-D-alanine-endopeptidase (penicillin-binding protein 4)|uniref:D-alanyl-D-alanine carboxypeptidase/D-alanyl-D-alanine endopeptidase n=1 Tax=Pseudophaeobacter sp. TaxID=1971739 RepID=UPI0025EEC211|nr:D-alanyl-D-alanine carboxypeptidase/D-alanyl-D-alanine-endopeptidase [uncultured Pseudophaeobacter sp.]
MFSRRFFLSAAAAALAAPAALANAPKTSLRPQARASVGLGSGGAAASRASAAGSLETFLARSDLSGQVACAVAEVTSGKELESHAGEEELPPASVAKALTALYALDSLGADYRFTTQILSTGTLSGGVLKGDLILAGGGDPMLNTDHLAQLAAALKKAGVREVRGGFMVWDGALPRISTIDADQPDHVGYSPAVAGIALNFNRVHFEWKRAGKSWSVAMDARTTKYRPGVSMARMKVANRALPVYTYADRNGKDSWTVASQALGKGGSRWLPVRRPADYAADVFRTMARAHGIKLKAAKRVSSLPTATLLAQHHSPPLDLMLKAMLKYSNNLMAEMIGMTATAKRGKRPRGLKDSAAEMSRWVRAKYGVSAIHMVDHSGLGEASRVAPNALLKVLVTAYKAGRLKPLLKSFPMRDGNGRIVKNHPIKVTAKTGTLNFVSGLGGFLATSSGTVLAFVIFAADTKARARISRAERERPAGARSWNKRAKRLQQQLIERWGQSYGT